MKFVLLPVRAPDGMVYEDLFHRDHIARVSTFQGRTSILARTKVGWDWFYVVMPSDEVIELLLEVE